MQPARQSAFTLVELLVVIVLVGLMTSIAMISFNISGVAQETESEAKRLHALMTLAQEEAIIQATEIAMEFDIRTYRFLEYKNRKWLPLERKVFKQRTLDDAVELTIETTGEIKTLKTESNKLTRIYFLSSGEQAPFSLRINEKNNSYPYYMLTGQFNGDLKLEFIEQ